MSESSLSRLEVAAALGDNEARIRATSILELPMDYRDRLEIACGKLSHRTTVKFALDCATRVIVLWETVRENDQRPQQAIQAARRWLSENTSFFELEIAGKHASDAAVEIDDPEKVPADVSLTSALHAAESAAHAAYTAECAARIAANEEPLISGVGGCAAWTASFAAKAACDPLAERQWQTARLCDYLLERLN